MINKITGKIINREGELVYKSSAYPILFEKDAEREAEEKKWVIKIGYGQYTLTEPLAKLFISFQKLVTECVEEIGFKEWIFPRLQTEEAIAAFGWFDIKNLRPELMKVAPFEKRKNEEEAFWFLDPLQCPSFYRTLQKISPIDDNRLPLKVLEWRGGWTYRKEKDERLIKGFGTCFEFSGAEIVYAGTEKQVRETRMQALIGVARMLDILELNYRIIVGSSCSHEKHDASLQNNLMEINLIPTMDIEVFVPSQNNYIEIGGGDVAGTRLINNFGIKSKTGIQLFSGCQGVGWQRLTKAFLSQKGFNKNLWPKRIKRFYQ